MAHLARGDVQVAVACIHNYCMDLRRSNAVAARLQRLRAWAEDTPLVRLLVVLGDHNFDAPHERPARVAPAADGGVTSRSQHRAGPAAWRALFGAMVELAQPAHTRMSEGAVPALSRIDRVYISAPPWIILQLEAQVGTIGTVDSFVARSISDHAPVTAVLAPRRPRAQHGRPLAPNWVFKTVEYAAALCRLEALLDMKGMPPFARLALHKELIGEAAQHAHRRARESHADGPRGGRLRSWQLRGR